MDGANEAVPIGHHANRVVKTVREPVQLLDVDNRVDTPAPNGDVVPRDGHNHDQAQVGGLQYAVEELWGHEEVREKVHLQRPLRPSMLNLALCRDGWTNTV